MNLISRLMLLFVHASVAPLFAQPPSVEQQSPRLQIQGETMGTYYSIIIDSPAQDAEADDLKRRVDATLAEFSRQMSTWDPDSEISGFNQSSSTEWYPVSPGFAEVVVESKRIWELSGGLFDPTVGPLIELWGFGKTRRRTVPDAGQIEQALRHVGFGQIEVRQDPPALRKAIPELQINLSAIAPGYAIDLIADLLKRDGHTSWLVDIGGEDQAGDPKASGGAWKIGVESPLGGLHKVIDLANRCVATSGDYRNFFELNGRRYSHALNPATGWPVENPPASVSVLSDSSMTADALATTLMVMGTRQGIEFAEQHQLDVMFLEVDDAGALRETSRGIFAEIPREAADNAANADEEQAAVTSVQPAGADQAPVPAAADSSPWWLPFAAALGIFLIALLGMSVGVIFRNKTLKGTCGGLSAMSAQTGQTACDLCTKPKADCVNPEVRARMNAADEDDEEFSPGSQH